MKKYSSRAFTLVELIVVITILAILGTIAFISLQGYSTSARDSSRVADMNNIEKSLTLFHVESGYYPEPTGGENITYSGGTVWIQGTIGDTVITNVGKLSKKPVDPLTGSEYTYSRLNNKNEFQIAGIFEGDDLSNISLGTYAAGTKEARAVVKGNYNGIVAKVSTGSVTYVLAVPTLISGDVTVTDIIDLQTTNKLVYNNFTNLPNSYKSSNFNLDGNFVFNPADIVIFSGDIDNLKNESEQIAFITNLQLIYSGSELSSLGKIKTILSYDVANDQSGSKYYSRVLIKNNINSSVKINVVEVTTPKTVLDCTGQGELIYGTSDGTDMGLTCTDDIIVCDGIGTGYTIASCNAGATVVFNSQTFSSDTTPRDASINSWAGGLYQWGNIAENSFTSTGGSQIGTVTYDSTYSNDTFIVGFNDWSNPSGQNNLWGDTTNTHIARRGPCNEGYHVPSQGEWVGLSSAGDGSGKIWDIGGTTTEGTDMMNALKLPMGGFRNNFEANVFSQGNGGNYWSSSPFTSTRSYRPYFHPSGIGTTINGFRGQGASVRCFKN